MVSDTNYGNPPDPRLFLVDTLACRLPSALLIFAPVIGSVRLVVLCTFDVAIVTR